MKKYVFLLIFTFSFLLQSEPYKPHPILFVHGLASNSGAWGASTKDPKNDRSEWICKDSVDNHPEETYAQFLNYMNPYAIVWDEIDPSYTHPGGTPTHPNPDPDYPNKAFLEVVNMDDPVGSVDEDYVGYGYNSPINGYDSWRDELEHIIEKNAVEGSKFKVES